LVSHAICIEKGPFYPPYLASWKPIDYLNKKNWTFSVVQLIGPFYPPYLTSWKPKDYLVFSGNNPTLTESHILQYFIFSLYHVMTRETSSKKYNWFCLVYYPCLWFTLKAYHAKFIPCKVWAIILFYHILFSRSLVPFDVQNFTEWS
jgi:hypothetical protein